MDLPGPVKRQPKTEQSKQEMPKPEEPESEQPKYEQSKIEVPKNKQPKSEVPKNELPTPDEPIEEIPEFYLSGIIEGIKDEEMLGIIKGNFTKQSVDYNENMTVQPEIKKEKEKSNFKEQYEEYKDINKKPKQPDVKTEIVKKDFKEQYD